MKIKTPSIVISLAGALFASGAEVKQDLAVEVPQGWQKKFEIRDTLPQYHVFPSDGQPFTSLFFHRCDPSGNPGSMQELTRSMISQTRKEGRKYTLGEIKGDSLSGQFVQFSFGEGITMIKFTVGDNDGIWSGHFVGPEGRWAEACEILRAIKRNG